MKKINIELELSEVAEIVNMCNLTINTNYKNMKENPTASIITSESINRIMAIKNKLKPYIRSNTLS